MRFTLAASCVLVLVCASAASGQITYLSDTRSVSAEAFSFAPLDETGAIQPWPGETSPDANYAIEVQPGGGVARETVRQSSIAVSPLYNSQAAVHIYRHPTSTTHWGGQAGAWQESTLAPDRVVASGGIRDMDAAGLSEFAVATSLLDVTFRLDQPATLDLTLDAREIPALGATCYYEPSCPRLPHLGELTYLLTGPGIDHSGRIETAVDDRGPPYPGIYTAPEVVSAFTLAESFEAAPGDYHIRLFAEGRGEPYGIDGGGYTSDVNWEPDRTWSVDVRVTTPIPEPATWLLTLAAFATFATVALRRRNRARGSHRLRTRHVAA